jgi:hypothetical protein
MEEAGGHARLLTQTNGRGARFELRLPGDENVSQQQVQLMA